MQTQITVKASKRGGKGKGPARRLRAAGKLPAIVYGPGQDGMQISVDPKDIRTVLNAPLGRNTVVTLDIDGSGQLAMLKSFDLHPVSRDVEHADFYMVALDRPVRVDVPLTTTGKAKGVAEGGILRQVFRKLPVKCTPDKIPLKLEIDVTNLELNSGLHVRELPLPAGVIVMLDPGQTIVSVISPEKETAETAPAAGAAAGAAGAAAPAAGAAAPAAGAAKGAAPAKDAKGAAPAKDAKAAAPAGGAKKK